MSRPIIILAATATALADFAGVPTVALAQSTQSEVVVFGTDPCPRAADSSIVICKRRPESERYRLPNTQRLQGSRQERQSWGEKSKQLTNIGSTGTFSCSAVGPGGYTGCLTQQIKQAKQEAREAKDNSTAPEQ
jgi:hypothetical protein